MYKKNTDELYYFHLDVMGSLVAITDESGILLESRNYDPWGKPRNPQTLAYTLSNPFGGSSSSYTLRGYTFHEHYEMFDLINMNGRLYDNQIGQFINADPILADNENLQNYNRYSYVMNNPLKYTDPSGYVYVGGGGAGTYGSGTSMEEISQTSRETERFEKGIQEMQDQMKNETLAFLLSSGGAGPINPAILGYMLPEFSTAPSQAKQSGTNFSWEQSLRQDGNYMPYYQMGSVYGNSFICPNCIDPSSIGHNLLYLTYPGGDNPKSYNGQYNYSYIPSMRSEYPAIGHDRRYDNLKIAGPAGLFTDSRAIGADYRFVVEEMSIAGNTLLNTRDRISAGLLGTGLGLCALPKTFLQMGSQIGQIQVLIWYEFSNQGVNNHPSIHRH